MCACYGELTAEVDSRLPAECRGNTGEADDAEPENLDSGPQVLLNLPLIGLGSFMKWCVACLVHFWSVLVVEVAAVCRNPSTYTVHHRTVLLHLNYLHIFCVESLPERRFRHSKLTFDGSSSSMLVPQVCRVSDR